MNQAVQVLDGCTYISTKEALKIDILEEGQMLACYIKGSNKEALTSLYNSKQFEIEEIIELELKEGKLNSDGEIWLTAEEVFAY
tara:strand:+ start:168 stop:419 length:252 start_codon:yes stop_codon:yes gene_type:complete